MPEGVIEEKDIEIESKSYNPRQYRTKNVELVNKEVKKVLDLKELRVALLTE